MILHGEVDNCRGSADGGCARSGFEVIRRGCAAERQIHVSVRIDSTRNNELMCSIDRLVESTCNLLQILSNEYHGGIIDKDVGSIGIDRSDNMSVLNVGFHRSKLYDIPTPGDKETTIWR